MKIEPGFWCVITLSGTRESEQPTQTMPGCWLALRVGKKLGSSFALAFAHCELLLKKCASSGNSVSELLAAAEVAAGAAEATALKAAMAAAVIPNMALGMCMREEDKKQIGGDGSLEACGRGKTRSRTGA